jgi:peptidyl-prolyl cis-trans isomerase B (cyclophilin B)
VARLNDKKPVLAVLAVLVVVVGFVLVANVLTAPKPSEASASSTETASASDTATSTETESATPSTPDPTPAPLAGCTPVAPPQAEPKRMSTGPDLGAAKGKTFVGTITTNCGDITVELNGTKAPAAVASFNLLAKENYWAPSPCHRLTVESIYVLQCGDPSGTGSGAGPGYHFGVENAPADGKYPRGTLALARTTDPNSNKDQFFITYKDTDLPTDGGGYTVFGTVTGGMEIVDKIAAAGVSPSDQMTPMGQISILSVSTKEKA